MKQCDMRPIQKEIQTPRKTEVDTCKLLPYVLFLGCLGEMTNFYKVSIWLSIACILNNAFHTEIYI